MHIVDNVIPSLWTTFLKVANTLKNTPVGAVKTGDFPISDLDTSALKKREKAQKKNFLCGGENFQKSYCNFFSDMI